VSTTTIAYITTHFDTKTLIPFIVKTACNYDWAPSVYGMRTALRDSNEVYLTQSQVAWIVANVLCGNNVNQHGFVHTGRKMGGNLYKTTETSYQLCAYFAGMFNWYTCRDQLDTIVVGYGGHKGSYMSPPTYSDNVIEMDYKCVNTLSDLPSQSTRLINAGNEPGGSYANDIGGKLGAQEESAFGLYPELFAGMFILPLPAVGLDTTTTNINMCWWVFGARFYAKTLPIGGSRVQNVGDLITDFEFYPLENSYKIFPTYIIGVAGYPSNGGPSPCNVDKTDCSACFSTLPEPLKRIYSRMFPALNTSSWPKSLKAFNDKWNLNQSFPYVSNPISGGAWGGNNTLYSIMQIIVTSQANWKTTHMCVDGGEGASSICTCIRSGSCDKECYMTQLAALKITNFCQAMQKGLWSCPERTC
jgi:hypothetical protein